MSAIILQCHFFKIPLLLSPLLLPNAVSWSGVGGRWSRTLHCMPCAMAWTPSQRICACCCSFKRFLFLKNRSRIYACAAEHWSRGAEAAPIHTGWAPGDCGQSRVERLAVS